MNYLGFKIHFFAGRKHTHTYIYVMFKCQCQEIYICTMLTFVTLGFQKCGKKKPQAFDLYESVIG